MQVVTYTLERNSRYDFEEYVIKRHQKAARRLR